MTRPVRIGLLGMFGGRNLGNEATLEAAVANLRRDLPTAELQCFCVVPAEVERKHSVPAHAIVAPHWRTFATKALNRVLLRWPSRIRNAIWAYSLARSVDVVMVPGTGTFDDFGEGPGGYPSLIFTWALMSRLARRPLMLVSVGAGPIGHPLSRTIMKWAASTARYRSYRDENSRQFMSSIGLDTRDDGVFPDLAFELDLRPTDGSERRAAGQGLVIGIGVMTYRGWRNDKAGGDQVLERYIGQLVDVIAWLAMSGHRVRLMIGEDSDLDTLHRVHDAAAKRVGRPLSALIEAAPTDTLQQLAREMATADVVIATRYHNVICALSCGIPTISIGYSKKNDAVMADFGLADMCQQIDTLDVAVLKRHVETTLRELPERRTEVAGRLAAVKGRLRMQSDRIRQFIGSIAQT